MQFGLHQIVGEMRRTPFPTDWCAFVIQHLAVQERLFTDLDIVDVGIEIDRTRVVPHQQGADNRLTQVSGRIGGGDGFNSDGTRIKVDVATGLILVGVFNVIFRPGDQNFVQTPDILDVVGELTHQDFEAVGVFDPGFVDFSAFFAGTGYQQGRYH
ncbi:hypothetical protein D3C78_903960 [compost metagenome]